MSKHDGQFKTNCLWHHEWISMRLKFNAILKSDRRRHIKCAPKIWTLKNADECIWKQWAAALMPQQDFFEKQFNRQHYHTVLGTSASCRQSVADKVCAIKLNVREKKLPIAINNAFPTNWLHGNTKKVYWSPEIAKNIIKCVAHQQITVNEEAKKLLFDDFSSRNETTTAP